MARKRTPADDKDAMRVVCGSCGCVLRETKRPSRFTSTGMCALCSRAFERGDRPKTSAAAAATPSTRRRRKKAR
jgi:hypothetical protein